MSRIRVSDGSSWPRPAIDSDVVPGIGWKLTHTPDQLTRTDLLEAASIISAYGHLVAASTQAKRDLVCRDIRAALKEES
jgi:hypothetical protein